MKALALLGLLGVLDPQAVARLLQLSLTEQQQPERPRAAARLAVKLHGTMVAQDERFSLALVDARTIGKGDVLEGRTVRGITKGCVLFDTEELCMGKKGPGPVFDDPAPKRGQAPFHHVALSDFARFTQIRVLPVPNGFKLAAIPKGSIYEELGIQSGDILRTVNGKPVDLGALQLVKPGAVLRVELERNGQLFALEGQLD
jgi:general secretion pathway protein C